MNNASHDRTRHEGRGQGPGPHGAPRILLAEDDVEMRKMVAWSLRHHGYDVIECRDGNSLLRHLGLGSRMTAQRGHGAADVQREMVDLIVSDIRMPGSSGLQVLASRNEFGPPTPMILITAFPDDQVREEARRLGAAALLAKPFEIDALLAKVTELAPPPPPAGEQTSSSTDAEQQPPAFPLETVFRHGSGSPLTKSFVRETARTLNRFAGRITLCRVVIDKLDPDCLKSHHYHMTISVVTHKKTLVVKHDSDSGPTTENLYDTIRSAFGAAVRQLEHYLRRQKEM